MNAQFVTPFSASRTRAVSSNLPSMSMATTARAIFDSCSVNQPSPQHRSTTVMPGATPTSRITPAGSGHSASHQPGSGIPVPAKKPGSVIRPDPLTTAASVGCGRRVRL
jgi:hypothetical protein